ncbi:pilus assembly protein PilP [Candidatus Electronema sp. PJ]|uniref:pilus assembly protein PilP n=1 Tax=Candidatus Electronema sp. PJ TaxID=3401572 RepID=UPI003AA8E2B5
MWFSSKKYLLVIITLFSAELFCNESALVAEEVKSSAETEVKKGEEEKKDKFEYQLDNRPDPFYPFISKEAAQKKDDDEIIDEESGDTLTGMRVFEPGQLRLVAVMGTQGSKIAMAEDVTGKGYILREGMLIGRRGQIMQIQDGKIIIKETAKTRAGREINNEVIMSLKKEDDKKGK